MGEGHLSSLRMNIYQSNLLTGYSTQAKELNSRQQEKNKSESKGHQGSRELDTFRKVMKMLNGGAIARGFWDAKKRNDAGKRIVDSRDDIVGV